MAKSMRQRRLAGFEDLDVPTELASSPPRAVSKPPEKPAKTGHLPSQGDADLRDKTVIVVDAHSLIYQVFHALPEMSSPEGEAVGAVHGFTRDLADLLEKMSPDYLFCAFDAPGLTFRHDLYAAYKEHREPMPLELRSQIPKILEMLEALSIPALQLPSYEADDILATLAEQVEQRGGRCILVTNDKDCRQLISQRVSVYNIRKDQLYDEQALAGDWGIRPEQVVDFQSLVGDKVDNVPGIPLIGPKLAKDLLRKYESLEKVLDHAHEVSGAKRRENLLQGRETALLSRELVRLDRQVPLSIDWAGGRVGGVQRKRVTALCRRFGFRRLGERLGAFSQAEPAEWRSDYRLVASERELLELAEELASRRRLAVDTETTGTLPRLAQIVGYSFAWEDGVACYVPVRAPRGEPRVEPQRAAQILRPLLENREIAKVGQNIKYDMIVLRGEGIRLQGVAFDTMVADYLLAPGERNHSLDDLASRYLNHETIKIEDLIGKGRQQRRMDEAPLEQVAPYACEDADIPLRLAKILERRLAEEELGDLFRDLEMPLVQVLAEMEWNGIRVDTGRLSELSQRFGARLQRLEEEIYALAGQEFNIDSRQQLGGILFEKLGLPILKKTKTGPSTDVDVLAELALTHPLPARIIDYRQFAKLKNTYVDALPNLIHPQTGRVHTSFKQDVAATGRLSSMDPNLQNIPVRTDYGREIRSAFLPEPGWRLLTADYSQIELRVLAHFCQDAALLRAFEEDQDIHALVAAEVYGVERDEVTRDMRRSAKAINFGVIYGQTPFGLAKALRITKEEAAHFIDSYFSRYPGVDAFMERVLADCLRNGYVSTILGRRRMVSGVRRLASRGSSRQRMLPERIAINTVIQGSAADLIKLAMLRVYGRLQQEQRAAKMLLQIHDELVLEVPPPRTRSGGGAGARGNDKRVRLVNPVESGREGGRQLGRLPGLALNAARNANRERNPDHDVAGRAEERQMMVVIGILGGVASGKSLVANCLREMGAAVLDADRAGHQVLRDPEVIDALRQRWGEAILDGQGQVNRAAVAKIVFDSAEAPEELAFLERVTHPRIGIRLQAEIRRLQSQGQFSAVVLDAPVMLKAGWDRYCDKIIYVDAPGAVRLERARARGWSEAEFDAREAAQESLNVKRDRADWVIDNSNSPQETSDRLKQFWASLP